MRAAALTDIGKLRSVNQDTVLATTNSIGRLPNLFLVADGMGGANAGDYASEAAVRYIKEYVSESGEPPIKALALAIEYANGKIYKEASENANLNGMGTTLVAATVIDGLLYVCNIGDSRLYLIREGSIEQITNDHSYVEEMVKQGKISRDSEEYLVYKNLITRAIGIDKNIEIDYFDVEIMKGDIILLCSDGLSNMVDNAKMKEIISLSSSMEAAAMTLIDNANINGGKDNISVVLIAVDESEVRI